MSSGDGDGRRGGTGQRHPQPGSSDPLLQEEGGGASAAAAFGDSENPQAEENDGQRSHGEPRLLLVVCRKQAQAFETPSSTAGPSRTCCVVW